MTTAAILDDMVDRLLRSTLPATADARRGDSVRARVLAAWRDAGLESTLSDSDDDQALQAGAQVAWRWGYHAAPLPVVEMLLVGQLRAQERFAHLPPAATIAARDAISDVLVAPIVESGGPILALTGHKLHLIDAKTAGAFHSLAGEPWLRIAGSGTAGEQFATFSEGERAEVFATASVLQIAQMTGAMARIVEIIIDHANTRQQFGRPLGKFQAVQTLIADAASEQVVGQAALAAVLQIYVAGAVPDLLLERSAKYQAGRAATIVAAAAHQVMGAMGFTEDHLLGHFTRRLWDWRDHWGRQDTCAAAIGRAAASDRRGLWPHLADGPQTQETMTS